MMQRNPGYCPCDPKAKVRVIWANGNPGREAYEAGKLRWTHTRYAFDIREWEVVE